MPFAAGGAAVLQGLVFEMSSFQHAAPTKEAGGTAGREPKYWLAIGIPTVPRKQANTTYLTATLESLLDEMPGDPLGALWVAPPPEEPANCFESTAGWFLGTARHGRHSCGACCLHSSCQFTPQVRGCELRLNGDVGFA